MQESKAEQGSRFKWQTALDAPYAFDPAATFMRDDLDQIEWSTDVKGVERSHSGAEVRHRIESSLLSLSLVSVLMFWLFCSCSC